MAELLPSLSPKMDHLVCFLPGVLALAHSHGLRPLNESAAAYAALGLELSYLAPAVGLAATCHEMYARTPVGLAPEIVGFGSAWAGAGQGDLRIKPQDAHSLLRPEAVEAWCGGKPCPGTRGPGQRAHPSNHETHSASFSPGA